ncbi:MAG: hypothetical protein C4B58_16655 [Deltaproteobacteria bacterium]|nr:MAG: hypothetical protein C4B58_16655 [Deltaproteobacteria bacterium]
MRDPVGPFGPTGQAIQTYFSESVDHMGWPLPAVLLAGLNSGIWIRDDIGGLLKARRILIRFRIRYW